MILIPFVFGIGCAPKTSGLKGAIRVHNEFALKTAIDCPEQKSANGDKCFGSEKTLQPGDYQAELLRSGDDVVLLVGEVKNKEAFLFLEANKLDFNSLVKKPQTLPARMNGQNVDVEVSMVQKFLQNNVETVTTICGLNSVGQDGAGRQLSQVKNQVRFWQLSIRLSSGEKDLSNPKPLAEMTTAKVFEKRSSIQNQAACGTEPYQQF